MNKDMRNLGCLSVVLFGCILVWSAVVPAIVAPASALPLSTLENSYAFLARKTAICLQPVPMAANPIRDKDLIAELHERGWLPESFKCGRCRYDLVGDGDAAYYLTTCGALTLE